MATYVIGDVHGCVRELEKLVEKIAPTQRDALWFVGDLVGKGPHEWEVLTFIRNLVNAKVILGNHDLHFLAERLASNPKKAIASGHQAELEFLCQQHLALWHEKTDTLCVHAGIDASWSVAQTLRYAQEIEELLQGSATRRDLFDSMYSNTANQWHEDLVGVVRRQTIINILTRIRVVSKKGRQADLHFSRGLADIAADYEPWYEGIRVWPCARIVFGHWAALKGRSMNPKAIALDGGLVYGGALLAKCLESGEMYEVAKD
jgi:bis(5'-nucleosyl)-tetraphosphatase (symmetrical)